METATTPWGTAIVLEQVSLSQRAGEKRFSSVVQLLELDGGERLVRFSYAPGGQGRRGPVTLRERDVERLRDALAQNAELKAMLLG